MDNEPPKHKVAASVEEAFDISEKLQGRPHGWIQFKGTDVCMDVHCVCGNLGHVDGEFMYTLRCSACKRVWAVNGHVELIELQGDGFTATPQPTS